MTWRWLVLGGLGEVGFTTSLRFVDDFRNVGWTLAFLASVSLSMVLLELGSRGIPMGMAHAVWGGIGALAPSPSVSPSSTSHWELRGCC